MSLDGKVAIVTGASRGIGKAMAMGLATEGAQVVVAARSEESRPMLPGTIHSTVGEIEDAGGKALAVACNVRDDDSIRELVEKTLDEYGSGIVINQVKLAKADPPSAVIDSFRDVQAARADGEIDQADGHRSLPS